MNIVPLHQIAPRWNEVLTPFRARDYVQALAVAQQFVAELESELLPYH
ncbi:hypothetical protein [Chromatium okenii]|nr:hypothetical protein [Chromatium okenii]